MSITINSLSKSFGDRVIFENFSYKFEDSGIYIIEGESGVGKTTLLRIIAGLDKAYDGDVIGGGIGMVSFMFQEYRLFPTISALDNILLVMAKSENSLERAKSLLIRLNLTTDDFSRLPSELSGGMKQRVAFARAILSDKPILLLDEPTKELDSQTADLMLEIIKEEEKNKTVIMVSHLESKHILQDSLHILL